MPDTRRATILAVVLACLGAGAARAGERPAAIDLQAFQVVDLTYAFDARTLYWPTAPRSFEFERLAAGQTPGGYYYSANAFCAPEHGGTHLDAPLHFAAGAASADQLGLEHLLGPAAVIDVAARAAADPDYRLTVADLGAWEKRHGPVAKGAVVLLRTGWGRRWPDRKAYFGDDTKGDASKLHFPSYGAEAVELLIQRQAAALGIDTASIDYGPSQDYPVHRAAAAAGLPGLENLANLDQLPETGAFVIALPMKIGGGSGGPLRAIALVPRQP